MQGSQRNNSLQAQYQPEVIYHHKKIVIQIIIAIIIIITITITVIILQERGKTLSFTFQMRPRISMTVGTTFPCKILNNGKEPCEPLMTSSYAHHSQYSIKTLTKHLRLVRKSILMKMLSKTMIVSYISQEITLYRQVTQSKCQVILLNKSYH